MTDNTLNRFLAYGTAADRAGFTPVPPTPASGPDPLYFWYETDTGNSYAYTTGWNQVNSSGGIYEIAASKPVVANYTLENAGTASMADGTYGIVLTMPSSTVNVRFVRLNAGLPGASWTAIMRASCMQSYDTANIHNVSFMVRNSTSGRLIIFSISGGQIVIQRWASYTSFNANIVTPFNTYSGLNTGWWKVTSDGTVLTFYRGPNGTDFGTAIGTETIATYLTATGGTLDQIGFGSVNGAASGVTADAVFESFTVT